MKEITMLSKAKVLNKDLTGNAQHLPTWSELAAAKKDVSRSEFEVVGCARDGYWFTFAVQRGAHPRKVRQAVRAGLRVVYA